MGATLRKGDFAWFNKWKMNLVSGGICPWAHRVLLPSTIDWL